MFARIYRPARNTMQSGQARTRDWLLEFEPEMAKRPDPLMGWTSTRDARAQVRLRFPTREVAAEYAKRHGIPFRVAEPKQPRRKPKSYSDNFAHDRKEPWSH
ncbi:MAG: ETC complex I subunit [Maricaulaceae bacterium]|nr:ETC complex I subunit [Maricaulaceae bacterium]